MPEIEHASSLRLLVAGLRWPPETFLERLIDGLLQAGMQVTVATANRPGAGWQQKPGFSWLPTPAWEGNSLWRLLRLAGYLGRALGASPGDLQRLAQHVRQNSSRKEQLTLWQRWAPYAGRRWDVLYFPWNSGAIDHLALFDLGMPVVLSCRGAQINISPHDPRNACLPQALQQTFEKAVRVHCVSRAIQEEASQFGLDPVKAVVIRPAVDPDFFLPALRPGKSNKTFTIVSTGSLIWRKGYEYALLSIRQLKALGVPVRYQIIGQGPEDQHLRYTIHDLGLEQQVELLGVQPPEAVRARLQVADVFLLCSLSEGISNAALEAMACALPVATTDCGGMREAVSDGVEGFVVPLRQPQAMGQALQMLWRDPALRRQMGARARARVLADFNQNRQIPQFVALFQQARQLRSYRA